MPLRVDFRKQIGGTTGRVDLMRVLASNSQIADDFDPSVIFSSNWPSARAEVFTSTVNTFTNNVASGSFTLARPYKTYPSVFPVFIVASSGAIFYPYLFMQKYNRNNGQSNGTVVTTLERLEMVQVDVISTGGNNYRIDYSIVNFGPNNKLGPGTIFIRACGQGT